jgi:DNA-binding response OmpR family regulator
VEALRARSYDALLLDWFMPELDGAGVLRAIQQEGHQVYVIVMSAQVDPDGFMELRHAGAHAFLAKPCGLTELCDALMDAPRRPRAPAPSGSALPIRAIGQA